MELNVVIVANTKKEVHSWNLGLLVLGMASPVSGLIWFMLLLLLLRLPEISEVKFAPYENVESRGLSCNDRVATCAER